MLLGRLVFLVFYFKVRDRLQKVIIYLPVLLDIESC